MILLLLIFASSEKILIVAVKINSFNADWFRYSESNSSLY